MTDADVDGAHIRTLLLTFFYRYQPQLFTDGPIYKVRARGKVRYCYTEKEREALLQQLGKGATVQRFKGLGEMMPQELWATTMDPKARLLKQVTVEDAAEADRLLSVLMGDEIAARRALIIDYAESLDRDLIDV